MNLNKIMNDFIEEYLGKEPLASKEDITELVLEVNKMLQENKDATPEEIINLIISDVINKANEKTENYPIEDYALGLKTNHTNIGIYSKPEMKDKLFDCNSIAMAIGDGVVLKCVNEGLMSYDDKIKDLDPRFEKLDDNLTLGDVAFYKAKLFTDGNLAASKNPEEANYKLFTMTGEKLDDYKYSDLNLPVLIKVVEQVTGRNYAEVAEDYIHNDLKLNNMHVKVPENKIHLITNTPNAKYGKCNDQKSILLDPTNGAGGAGALFANSEDLKTYMMNIRKHIPNIDDKEYAYVQEKGGVWQDTYVDDLDQNDTIALHGRYTTEAVGNERGAHTVLLDSASVPLEVAKEQEEKINKAKEKQDKSPITIVKNLEFYHNGQKYKYNFNDSRMYLPINDFVTEELINENAKALLKIKFLEKVIENYDKTYLNNKINIDKIGKSR